MGEISRGETVKMISTITKDTVAMTDIVTEMTEKNGAAVPALQLTGDETVIPTGTEGQEVTDMEIDGRTTNLGGKGTHTVTGTILP